MSLYYFKTKVYYKRGLCFGYTESHARLCKPPSRSYMWREGYDTPANYNDNELNCGGFGTQWSKLGGQCGICGDRWEEKAPRSNEAGGTYGLGIIVEEYKQGGILEATVQVTANHKGYFEFRVCPTNDPKKTATQKCLDQYLLKQTNGETKFELPLGNGNFTVKLELPQRLTCKHCVLQWRYHTGNSFGCFNSNPESCCIGCGPKQEEFYSCSDIAITTTGNSGFKVFPGSKPNPPVGPKPVVTPRPWNPVITKPTKNPWYNPKPAKKTTTKMPATTTLEPTRRTTKISKPYQQPNTENTIPKDVDECFDFCFKFCTRNGKCPPYCEDCFKFSYPK